MSIKAMKQALEALEYTTNLSRFLLNDEANIGPMLKADEAITSLRQAIAEAEKQEQSVSVSTECVGEPVAWNEDQAYAWGRGCYEIAQGATTEWKLFGQLTTKEQAYWVAKAAFEQATPQQRKPLNKKQRIAIIESLEFENSQQELIDAVEAAHGIKE